MSSDVFTRRVFLSYSRADGALAGRLVADLEANGVDVWQDVKSIAAGDSITRAIEGALTNCTALILLLTARAVDSRWVEREYRAALNLQRADPDSVPRILPALAEQCVLPPFLQDILYADFRPDYATGFTTLVQGLGIEHPRMPSVTVRQDIEALVEKVNRGCAIVSNSYAIPSHELFDVWSPLEDELRRLVAIEIAMGNPKLLERSRWAILPRDETDDRPALDNEPFPRNLFLQHVAQLTQETIQLAERFGIKTNRPSVSDSTFWEIGGSPPSN